jgi:hypothetical protein
MRVTHKELIGYNTAGSLTVPSDTWYSTGTTTVIQGGGGTASTALPPKPDKKDKGKKSLEHYINKARLKKIK